MYYLREMPYTQVTELADFRGSESQFVQLLGIDPANISSIWIVDSGTDKVYQFDASAGQTAGSKTSSLSFALAVGNTNPQGIADPPPQAVPISALQDCFGHVTTLFD